MEDSQFSPFTFPSLSLPVSNLKIPMEYFSVLNYNLKFCLAWGGICCGILFYLGKDLLYLFVLQNITLTV